MLSKIKKNKSVNRCALIVSGSAVLILLICCLISFFWQRKDGQAKRDKLLPKITIQTRLLDKNKFSRPGLPLSKVRGVVVHYTANAGSNAIDNRNYFNNLPKTNHERKRKIYASSHFIIGIEGQIVQCIPLDEMSYASNDRNSDTISIECCHPKKNGKFTAATYQALLELTSYLCIRFDLSADDVIRHYDVTGKLCPKYFVKHEDKWLSFKKQVGEKIKHPVGVTG